MLKSSGVSDTDTSVMNPWNTLPESYQQRVYKNTLRTVKRQIKYDENPTLAVVINMGVELINIAVVHN
jgi:hypothetical protein